MPTTEVSRDLIRLLYLILESGSAIRQLDEIDRLAAIRVDRSPGFELRENVRVLDALRLALHYTANVSRMLWPAPFKRSEYLARKRSEFLLTSLGLQDDHFLKSRKLRDHIEHMDERLDVWAGAASRPLHTFSMVLFEDFDLTEKARADVINSTFLVLEPGQGRIHLMSEEFTLVEIRAGLEDVQTRTSLAIERFHQ